MNNIAIPAVNARGGTSPEALFDQARDADLALTLAIAAVMTLPTEAPTRPEMERLLSDAVQRLREARAALGRMAPNRLDYAGLGESAWTKAIRQHQSRMDAVESVSGQIETLMAIGDVSVSPIINAGRLRVLGDVQREVQHIGSVLAS